MSQKPKIYIIKIFNFSLLFLIMVFGSWIYSYAEDQKGAPTPIAINADTVEYSGDSSEVTASGHVEIDYKGSKMRCDKLKINTQTKEGEAEGHVKLEDAQGIIEGEKITYNFDTKTGTIMDAQFRANPYFGRAAKIEKISDNEIVALLGYATTCNLDHPHYRIGADEIDLFPKDKIQTRSVKFHLGELPVVYIPRFNRSLKDTEMKYQFTPGNRKDWGTYILGAYRYNLADNINGRLYLDYRQKLGFAGGFGINYDTKIMGKGDLKYYYTHETPENKLPADLGTTNQSYKRGMVRWRHQWQVDERTNIVTEYYRVYDTKRKRLGGGTTAVPENNFLKDYFYREYEADAQPLTYALLHRAFNYASLDVLVQKRVNHWYNQLETLPEIRYSLPSIKIGNTPFYFENSTMFDHFNQSNVDTPTVKPVTVTRLDSYNKISWPLKIAFVQVKPYVANRETVYSSYYNHESYAPRTIFYSGADLSTRFYRFLNVKTGFLGLDINGLRHIITPTVAYAYNHEPTISSNKIKQIDGIDSITRNNSISVLLSNKLQTKRGGNIVDVVDFRVSTTYNNKPKPSSKTGSSFSDFLFEMELLPYSWLRIDGDATYKHSGSRGDPDYNRFTTASLDVNFDFAKGRTIGFGQRYERKGAKELTFNSDWRINPKWKFGIYERYQFNSIPDMKKGLREQQYTIARDMHCWTAQFTYDIDRVDGHSFWFIFRLKAFPDMEFNFEQSYHKPKMGSQTQTNN